jgi:hypothetical protein
VKNTKFIVKVNRVALVPPNTSGGSIGLLKGPHSFSSREDAHLRVVWTDARFRTAG